MKMYALKYCNTPSVSNKHLFSHRSIRETPLSLITYHSALYCQHFKMQVHVCIHHSSAVRWQCIQAGFFPQASASSIHLDMKKKKETQKYAFLTLLNLKRQ